MTDPTASHFPTAPAPKRTPALVKVIAGLVALLLVVGIGGEIASSSKSSNHTSSRVHSYLVGVVDNGNGDSALVEVYTVNSDGLGGCSVVDLWSNREALALPTVDSANIDTSGGSNC